jgi:glycosyltransferase involved in cell wall biosynthesis
MTPEPLVIFSPLPPARNGLADYVDGLLPYLSEAYRCHVVIPDDAPDPEPICGEVLFESEYHRARSLHGARHLYQLGNNTGVAYTLPTLLERPGIVTVHDLSILSMAAAVARGAGHDDQWPAVVGDAHGAPGVEAMRALAHRGMRFSAAANEFTLMPLVAERSLCLVGHSRLAHSRLRTAGAFPVALIPCFAPIPKDAARPSLRASRDHVEILCAGFRGRSKRLDLALEALRRLRDSGLPVRLTIAGEPRPQEYDVDFDVERLGLADSVRLLDYQSEAELSDNLAGCDILLNLRWPTTGESSGPLLRALWLGRCAVVTDVGAYSEFPDDVVVKVPLDRMSGEGVAGCLAPLARSAFERRRIGDAAARFAKAELSPALAAKRYIHLIRMIDGRTAPHLSGNPTAVVELAEQAGDAAGRGQGLLDQAIDAGLLPHGQLGSAALLVSDGGRSREDNRMAAWGYAAMLGCSPSDVPGMTAPTCFELIALSADSGPEALTPDLLARLRGLAGEDGMLAVLSWGSPSPLLRDRLSRCGWRAVAERTSPSRVEPALDMHLLLCQRAMPRAAHA